MLRISLILVIEEKFEKKKIAEVNSLGTPYDVSSLMHYGPYAFGIGKMTIKAKDPAKQHLIGQAKGFSRTDIQQINLMYRDECSKRTKNL